MTWVFQRTADALVLAGGMLSYFFGALVGGPLLWLGGLLMAIFLLAALALDPGVFHRESLWSRSERWRAWGFSE
jgi:hypothetical protein